MVEGAAAVVDSSVTVVPAFVWSDSRYFFRFGDVFWNFVCVHLSVLMEIPLNAFS